MPKHSDTLGSLKPADYNPRKPWSDTKADKFSESLTTYGDLSGVIRNNTTGNLVGGHKRVDEFRKADKVTIEKEPCKKDAQGTVAYGHVIADGNRFAYREVEWPLKKEKQANIAANAWGADWDTDALESSLREMDEAERLLVGMDDADLDALGINLEEPQPGTTPEAARATLAEQFIVPPFSVLDARQGYWQDRKRAWLALGIQSEVGRGGNLLKFSEQATISVGGKKAPPKSYQHQGKK